MIINNTPLTYVCPNTIKTYLTPNHLLLGRQLLYYSNTTSTVVRNLTVLSSTTDKINRISNHFWHRWRHEYVVNLRETQRASKLNINSQKLCCASLWWKGARHICVEILTQKGAIVRIKKANAILKHSVNKLFQIEHTYHDKAREQRFKWDATVIGELKRKYEC